MEVGQTGKILIRGPQVMSGYQNNPEATAAVIDKDGYFDTGASHVYHVFMSDVEGGIVVVLVFLLVVSSVCSSRARGTPTFL